MIKTDINHIAKPSSPLIMLGVLKGYIRRPLLFFIKSLLTFNKYYKDINIDLPKDFKKSYGLIAWLYIRLQKHLTKDKAFEVIRATILCAGFAVQQSNFRNVEAKRCYQNLIKYQQLAKKEGSTKLNQMEVIEQSDTRYTFKVTRCMFYEFFNYLNVSELTKIMCSIDNAIFNSYLPEEITFHRSGIGNRMVDGADHCKFIIQNNM